MIEKQYAARAFVSCSLRPEDQGFVNYVCRILDTHNIEPFGTVGKFSASPENPITLMNRNIPLADFVVICATPRYIQKDIKTGVISHGLSEMVHVETGIAIAHNKPVVVFVQEGTYIGNALPNITQYIILNGNPDDYKQKSHLIYSLLNNAYLFVKKVKENKDAQAIGNVALKALAIYGGYKALKYIFGNEK